MPFYLSPSAMYQRVNKANNENRNMYLTRDYNNLTQQLQNSFNLYEFCSKQYFGLGSLLQFIPGTNARRARVQLSNELEPALQSLKKDFSYKPASVGFGVRKEFYWFKKLSFQLPLYSYLNFGLIFSALDEIADGYVRIGMVINLKMPLIRIAFNFPILRDIFFVDEDRKIQFRSTPFKNLVHSLLNPARIVDNFLEFLHLSIFRILDIGSQRQANSSIPRILLKGLAGVIFGTLRLPVKIIKHTVDIPLSIVDTLIITPISHILSSIKYAYQNSDKEVLITTVKKLQDVKELRRTAKGHQNTRYSAITKAIGYNQEYIGISKDELYDNTGYATEPTPEKLVAVRASGEKIAVTSSLLSIISFFGAQDKTAEDYTAAIEQAKAVLSIK